MDIASNCPFVLEINKFPCKVFTTTETDIYSDLFPTIKIQENEEVYVLFDAQDKSARLYLEALDILPDGNNILVDDDGMLYRPVSSSPFPLYKHGNEYDALRVDAFRICVVCQGVKYYTLLEIRPKQMSISEWTMMRDDLENEIRGLAQDIVRRNIGLGGVEHGAIPPEKIYRFFVVKKYAPRVLAALIGLQNSPKYQIVTQYIEEDSSKAVKMDSITVKKFLRKGGFEAVYSVPVKRINYDIQENRLLKQIVTVYDRELAQFTLTIERITEARKNRKEKEHAQYQHLYDQGLKDFLTTANKLKKITTIIKTQDWYKTIGPLRDGMVPHSFVLDSRYGILYKMYEELRNSRFDIHMDPFYSYSWKKSSSMYEMWCYIKICRAFAEDSHIVGNTWNLQFVDDMLFPYLTNGTKMSFANDEVRVDVIFDQFVPTKPSQTRLHDNPFYTVGRHRRPDITIDIYTVEDDWYIGSIILECKYRKLSSFWTNNSEWSAKPQIQAYYTDNKSNFTYNGFGGEFDICPIQSVIVLTPDIEGEGMAEERIHTLIKTLKPDMANKMAEHLMQAIQIDIQERCSKAARIKKLIGMQQGIL